MEGDLIFFSDTPGGPTHVGVVSGIHPDGAERSSYTRVASGVRRLRLNLAYPQRPGTRRPAGSSTTRSSFDRGRSRLESLVVGVSDLLRRG